ncbi:hypothetical protein [Salana multivorans]
MNPQLGVILAGGLVGAGAFLLLRPLLGRVPALGPALARLNGLTPSTAVAPVVGEGLTGRAGAWAQRQLGDRAVTLVTARPADLALLERPRHMLLGEKVTCAVIGLLTGPLLALVATLLGLGLGAGLPVAACLLLAALGWFLPDQQIRTAATTARREYAAALGAYLDLVAIARVSGDAANEAMVRTAGLTPHPAFARIAGRLQHATWAGQAPWDALTRLRHEIDVPEIGDIADIMRITDAGGQVVTSLRERARALREGQLAAEHAHASSGSERLTIAMSLTGALFLLMLLYPSAVAMLR